MSQTGYDHPVEGDAAAKLSAQRARQGQDIKGMVSVLVIGIILVAAAYMVMLALQAKPVTPGNELAPHATDVAPTPGPGGVAPATPQETAQSPG